MARRTMYLSLLLILLGASLAAASARAQTVDWKMYGGASIDSASECFYDAVGVVRKPTDHIEVWTKCLRQTDLDAVDIQKEFGGKIMENSAQKITKYYIPPIGAYEDLDSNQMMQIVVYEETANISYIKPQSRILYEFDCPGRMVRELSISIDVKGKVTSSDTANAWRHMPPEGSGSTLMRILCPLS